MKQSDGDSNPAPAVTDVLSRRSWRVWSALGLETCCFCFLIDLVMFSVSSVAVILPLGRKLKPKPRVCLEPAPYFAPSLTQILNLRFLSPKINSNSCSDVHKQRQQKGGMRGEMVQEQFPFFFPPTRDRMKNYSCQRLFPYKWTLECSFV